MKPIILLFYIFYTQAIFAQNYSDIEKEAIKKLDSMLHAVEVPVLLNEIHKLEDTLAFNFLKNFDTNTLQTFSVFNVQMKNKGKDISFIVSEQTPINHLLIFNSDKEFVMAIYFCEMGNTVYYINLLSKILDSTEQEFNMYSIHIHHCKELW